MFFVQCRFIANKEKGEMHGGRSCIARLSSFGLTSILVYFFWPVPFHSE